MLRGAVLSGRRGALRTVTTTSNATPRSSCSGKRRLHSVVVDTDSVADDSVDVPIESQATRSTTVPTPIATAMALAEQLEHPKASKLGQLLSSRPAWLPNGSDWGLTTDEIVSAKGYLDRLRERLDKDYEPQSEIESAEDVAKRRLLREKGMTPRLGRMLVAIMRREQYRHVEAIAFLWEDVFPEYAHNTRHWSVICEHYAKALIKQRRSSEVVEALFTNWYNDNSGNAGSGSSKEMYKHVVFTPHVMGLVLEACGYVKDVQTAIQVLKVAKDHGFRLREDAYFRFLDELLRGDPTSRFDGATRFCKVLVRDLGEPVPVPIVPVLLRTGAECGKLQQAIEFYSPQTNTGVGGFAEYNFDVCLMLMWDHGHQDETLRVLRDLVVSSHVSSGMKARICKGLLRKALEPRHLLDRGVSMDAVIEILNLMEDHHIKASSKVFPSLLTALIQDQGVRSVAGFVEFIGRYPNVMEWNSFMVCELLLVAVRLGRAKLIDELVLDSLNAGIPVKYVALESVVAFYYRTGKFASIEKAAAIIRAMRHNHHLPLGMSLTEIGMTCNLKLGRYEEVVLLFEDFAKRDGVAQRSRSRKPMLFAASKAYTELGRHDEANALEQIIKQQFPRKTPPRRSAENAQDDSGDDELDGNSPSDVQTRVGVQ